MLDLLFEEFEFFEFEFFDYFEFFECCKSFEFIGMKIFLIYIS